jgi:hypothetical protein
MGIEEKASARHGKRRGGGHASPANGCRRAPPRGRPTGGRGRPRDAEEAADARARARGRERGG